MKNDEKRGVSKRTVAILLALVLVIGCAVGGTLAWLTAQTSEVKNTFAPSDIKVDLKESKDLDLKMVPGWTIKKDPQAAVFAGSEKAYLFVKLEKSSDFDDFMTYSIAEGWTKLALTGVTYDVYYRVVDGTTNKFDTYYSVLANDQVKVKGSVTKDQMNALLKADGTIDETKCPTLTVTAYASQYMKNNTERFSENEAWANIGNPTGETPQQPTSGT